MPIVPYIDRVDNLSLHEVHGIIMQLTRKIKVCGIPTPGDYSILLQGLITAGVPVAGDPLVPLNSILNPWSMLVLVDRKVTLMPDDNSTVEVICDYERFTDSDNQELSPPGVYSTYYPNSSRTCIFGRMKASVQQTKTNFFQAPIAIQLDGTAVDEWSATSPILQGKVYFYNGFYWYARSNIPDGSPQVPDPLATLWRIAVVGTEYTLTTNYEEQAIVVANTFTDPKDGELRGITKYQTGEITVMQPHKTYTVEGNVYTNQVDNLANAILGKINSVSWMNGGTWEWMCTEVSWECLFAGSKSKIKFDFQHNPDTWQPTAVFTDSRTGKPPVGLIPGFGSKQINYHDSIDFNKFFGAQFEQFRGAVL